MADIRLSSVNKLYSNGHGAVSDLDLHIRDGEFMVLVGPSGCGKSTILRMIAGLEEITGGELRIGGRLVNDMEPKERDIAMVFQSYALYPHMSVAQNIGFPLRLSKIPQREIDERVREAARILELEAHLDRRPAQLSGGQRQRVAMGRAIVRKPSVYLLDEPLSNLDAKLREQTRAEIVDLQARLGVTTVYVTHDQVEAMTMGHRVAVLKDGILQQCDAPRTLYSQPANIFVAGFIGTPSMNFVTATSDGQTIAAGELRLPLPDEIRRDPNFRTGAGLTLGVRPEHVAIGSEGASARVIGVEELGAEAILRLAWPGGGTHDQLVVRVPGGTLIGRGDEVRVSFPNNVHLFAEDGSRLGSPARAEVPA
jgi:multiple sugar transport system ATP-binding protein